MAGLVPAISIRRTLRARVQIAPGWVCLKGLARLPCARPVLDVLFSLDRRIGGVVHLEMDQAIDPVPAGEPFDDPCLVLVDAAHQVVCDSNISAPPGRLARI